MSKDGGKETDSSVRIKLWQSASTEATASVSPNQLFEQAEQLVAELGQKGPHSSRVLRVDSLDIVPATRTREYRWCSSAQPLPVSEINRWLLKNPPSLSQSSEESQEGQDVFAAFQSLHNFHHTDDVASSSSSDSGTDSDKELTRSVKKSAPLFSQTSATKKRKLLHTYARKSTGARRPVEIRPYEAFKELLAESAEDRLVDSSPPRKKVMRKSASSAKKARSPVLNDGNDSNAIHAEEEHQVKRKLLLTQAAPPALPRARTAQITATKPAKSLKPLRLRLNGEAKPSDLIGLGRKLHEEATEVIEDYSDASMHMQGDNDGGMVLDDIRRHDDTIIISSNQSRTVPNRPSSAVDLITVASTSRVMLDNAPANVSFASTMSSTSMILSTASMVPHSLPLRSTNLPGSPNSTILPSNRRTSLEVPPPAQRKKLTASSTLSHSVSLILPPLQGEDSNVSAPTIALTTPTSPPNPISSSPIPQPVVSSTSSLNRKRKRIDESIAIPLPTFLRVALPPELLRPSFPPTIPFRHMSKPVAAAPILHTYVNEEDLSTGGIFGDGYLGAGRRGWWALSLEGAAQVDEETASGGTVLGLEQHAVSNIAPGSIVWTIPRLRLLFKQVHAMTKTRKWGSLDIYVSPSTPHQPAHQLRIVCQASLALMLRTILGEIACRLDSEGNEMEEQADESMRKEEVGEMWLSSEKGIRLAWWDEIDRKEILLA